MDRSQVKEHLTFAGELGVAGVSRDPAWRRRPASPRREPEAAGAPGDARPAPLSFSRTSAEALTAVRADIGDCTRCKLHALGRTQIVFGVGNPDADLMFVGEAPGGDEDIQGIPFVGRAGQLLTDIIEKGLQIPRKDVYIANVIKCRPPGNRNPEPDELARCEPFLIRQLQLVQPKIILAMGRFAVQSLLKSGEPIGRLRGRVHQYQGVPLVVTYHPAYLLRNPQDKARAWEDLCLAADVAARGA